MFVNENQHKISDTLRAGDTLSICLAIQQLDDPNITNKYGKTPLMFAAAFDSELAIGLLLDKGASINHTDLDDNTALIIAATRGNYKACQILLRTQKVHINMIDNGGNTALIMAASCGHKDLCKLLLEYGADKSISNYLGITASYCAELAGHNDLISLFKEVA